MEGERVRSSEFQLFHQNRFINFGNAIGINFIPEMWLPGGRYVNLGTKDRKYGIEIKSGTGDLKTGYGLNVDDFEFSYIAIPEKFVNQAIGYSYINGHDKCGVIAILNNNRYSLAKAAKANLNSPSAHFLDLCISSADEIQHTFWLWEKERKNDICAS